MPVAAFRAATLLLVMICFARSVDASCGGDYSPPCQAYWNASAVFVGMVTQVTYSQTLTKGEGEDFWHYRRRITRFAVEEAFRGVEPGQVEVVATEILPTPVKLPDGSEGTKSISSGDCEYRFSEGGTYMVYAHRADSRQRELWVGLNRTRPLARAGEDLEYIRGLARTRKPGVTIYGTIARRDRDLKDGNSHLVGGVTNVKVTLEGGSLRSETVTDAEGRYRFAGLPPGTYKVAAVMPAHLTSTGEARQARVAARGCAQIDFHTEINGRISGRVLDAQGQIVPKMGVDLVLAELENERHPQSLWAFTDETGRYELKAVPPGRYHLGIRLTSLRDADFPYPRIYYPGVQDATKATVIEVEEGGHLQDYDLQLPPPLAERMIEGVVVWGDGQPVAGASVSLTITSYEYNFAQGGSGLTDEQGRFKVKAREGLAYWIGAMVSTKKNAGGQMHAEPVDIPASGDVHGVRLVVESPMGNCPRCHVRIWRPSKKESGQN